MMPTPLKMNLMRQCDPAHAAELSQHCQKWNGCKACQFGENGGNKVYYRGQVPADVLFIGQAPTTNDHATRLAMSDVEPRDVMNLMIIDLARRIEKDFRWCIGNLVLCAAFNKDGDECTPKMPELSACSHRLAEFIQVVKPKIIVRVGVMAKRIIPDTFPIILDENAAPRHAKSIDMIHPAWYGFQKDPDFEVKKMTFTLTPFFKANL